MLCRLSVSPLTTACRPDPSLPGVVQTVHRVDHLNPELPQLHLRGQHRQRAERSVYTRCAGLVGGVQNAVTSKFETNAHAKKSQTALSEAKELREY